MSLGAAAPSFPPALVLVHEDDDLLVVDKPPGLLTVATESERERTAYRMLFDYVAAQRGAARLFVVHRLDRETSGLLVFAKSAAVKRALQAQFEARTVERVYAAVVEGRVHGETGTLRDRVAEDPRTLRVHAVRAGGREAITAYRVVERRARSTRLELVLGTGRRGQIRAQLAARRPSDRGRPGHGHRRQRPRAPARLHAQRLGFRHPRAYPVEGLSATPAIFARA